MPEIPDQFAQINHVLSLTGDNEEMMVTMGLNLNSTESTDDLAVVNAAFTAFANRFKAFLYSAYTFKRIDARINRGAGIISVSSSATPVAGTGSSQPLPQNCAYLIHKQTAAGGRTGKGRWYLPSAAEGVVDSVGNIDGATITAMNTACASYLSDMSAISGVNSVTLLHSLVGDIPNDIVSMVLDGKIATQRRRLR